MNAPELKYGRRNVVKMIREWDALRQAIRAEGTPMVQSALDQVEEHIDYAYRADLAAVQPDPRDEVTKMLVEALEMMRSTYPYNPPCYGWQEQVEAHKAAKAALAAAIGCTK